MKLKVLVTRLLGCVFVMIFIVVLGQKGIKDELHVTGITTMFAQKEAFDGTVSVHMRKLGLGGKKLLMAHEEGAHGPGGTSKISGKDQDALKKSIGSFQEQKNDQKKHMSMVAPKALKFTNFVIPRSIGLSNTDLKCSQDSNPVVPVKARITSSSRPQPHGTTSQKDETKALFETAKEIVNLIHKDYKGTGPRGKPPINNHEPRN